MSFTIRRFSGVAPRVSPNKLAPDMAQTANNVRLLAGTLASWMVPLTVATGFEAANKSTIYRFGQDLASDTQYWFHWTVDVDVVKGAIADDQTERTYFTHPTLGARQTNNSLALTGGSGGFPRGSYPLGIPAPTSAPVASVQTNGSGNAEDWIYTVTLVSILGEEGPPSLPSNQLTVKPSGHTVLLTSLPIVAPAGYSGYITAKRIYRSAGGAGVPDYRLLDEIPISQSTYSDSMQSENLKEILPSLTWTPPPPGCFGITGMANGITLLFKGYDVYPSEAYIPYAYPVEYQQAVDYPIVGGKAIGSSAVIVTTGHPYLMTGSDPSTLSMVRLDNPQACVSKRSLAAADGGVIYASPDGLVFVSTSGLVTVVTAALFSRDEWQKLVPSSIDGYFHDGRYFGFYNTGQKQGGFIFDPAQGSSAFTFIDTFATAGFEDLYQDALYLKVGSNIVKWGAGDVPLSYVWKSAIFEMLPIGNPACAQVVCRSFPVVFKLFADGVLKHTHVVANSDPFWLPSGYSARFLEVEISGAGEVLSVGVAARPELLGRS